MCSRGLCLQSAGESSPQIGTRWAVDKPLVRTIPNENAPKTHITIKYFHRLICDLIVSHLGKKDNAQNIPP